MYTLRIVSTLRSYLVEDQSSKLEGRRMRGDIVTGHNYTSKLVRPAQCSADRVHRMMRVVQCLFQCTNKSDYESRIIDDKIYDWFARTIDRLIRITLTCLSITLKITFREFLYIT